MATTKKAAKKAAPKKTASKAATAKRAKNKSTQQAWELGKSVKCAKDESE